MTTSQKIPMEKMIKMIKKILFDVDGTLYNETDAKAVAELLTAKYISDNSCFSVETVFSVFIKAKKLITRQYQGIPKANDRQIWFSYVLNELGIKNVTGDAASKYYWGVVFDNIKPYEDFLYILPKIKRKYKLYVLSDERKNLCIKKLQRLGLENTFEKVISSEEIGMTKPSKEIFQYAMEKIDGKYDETIIVGDNPITDIKGGNLFGINSALLMRGKYFYYSQCDDEKPDIEFVNYIQLIGKIDELDKKLLNNRCH